MDAATVRQIHEATEVVGREGLRPIFDFLGGKVDYESIRIVLTCLNCGAEQEPVATEARRCA